ncbi:50S ribosomal protein L6 [Stagnimonas aquatica]|uniref:Large ribosomal subunit protein uL6 n=1 Tax=Stagnimonas aquatica TaxID=2689987 RepID=A0A3N0VIF5_9GAMM|nr:50S ribosomal protein L6 [Stagnimonas aquatica]ROH91998.1 50S ribosomal protein L6 [Stagnimonas aquatica]
MSRVAKNPIKLPAGVQLTTSGGVATVKGAKASLTLPLPAGIAVDVQGDVATISAESIKSNKMLAGTMRALLNNMVVGVTKGYEIKLQLVGVGYRAAMKGKLLDLQVGLSHPVNYPVPEGISVETPTQTEIVIKGADKRLVGQVAADIRSYREPEPYKGKGVRYSDEKVILKEAKKK